MLRRFVNSSSRVLGGEYLHHLERIGFHLFQFRQSVGVLLSDRHELAIHFRVDVLHLRVGGGVLTERLLHLLTAYAVMIVFFVLPLL